MTTPNSGDANEPKNDLSQDSLSGYEAEDEASTVSIVNPARQHSSNDLLSHRHQPKSNTSILSETDIQFPLKYTKSSVNVGKDHTKKHEDDKPETSNNENSSENKKETSKSPVDKDDHTDGPSTSRNIQHIFSQTSSKLSNKSNRIQFSGVLIVNNSDSFLSDKCLLSKTSSCSRNRYMLSTISGSSLNIPPKNIDSYFVSVRQSDEHTSVNFPNDFVGEAGVNNQESNDQGNSNFNNQNNNDIVNFIESNVPGPSNQNNNLNTHELDQESINSQKVNVHHNQEKIHVHDTVSQHPNVNRRVSVTFREPVQEIKHNDGKHEIRHRESIIKNSGLDQHVRDSNVHHRVIICEPNEDNGTETQQLDQHVRDSNAQSNVHHNKVIICEPNEGIETQHHVRESNAQNNMYVHHNRVIICEPNEDDDIETQLPKIPVSGEHDRVHTFHNLVGTHVQNEKELSNLPKIIISDDEYMMKEPTSIQKLDDPDSDECLVGRRSRDEQILESGSHSRVYGRNSLASKGVANFIDEHLTFHDENIIDKKVYGTLRQRHSSSQNDETFYGEILSRDKGKGKRKKGCLERLTKKFRKNAPTSEPEDDNVFEMTRVNILNEKDRKHKKDDKKNKKNDVEDEVSVLEELSEHLLWMDQPLVIVDPVQRPSVVKGILSKSQKSYDGNINEDKKTSQTSCRVKPEQKVSWKGFDEAIGIGTASEEEEDNVSMQETEEKVHDLDVGFVFQQFTRTGFGKSKYDFTNRLVFDLGSKIGDKNLSGEDFTIFLKKIKRDKNKKTFPDTFIFGESDLGSIEEESINPDVFNDQKKKSRSANSLKKLSRKRSNTFLGLLKPKKASINNHPCKSSINEKKPKKKHMPSSLYNISTSRKRTNKNSKRNSKIETLKLNSENTELNFQNTNDTNVNEARDGNSENIDSNSQDTNTARSLRFGNDSRPSRSSEQGPSSRERFEDVVHGDPNVSTTVSTTSVSLPWRLCMMMLYPVQVLRRAVRKVRMVLDPKSTSHNDYGSIHEFAPHALLSPKSSSVPHPEPVDEQQPAGGGGPPPAGTTELPQTSSTMTQRQPLLPITNVWGRAVPGKSSSDDYSDTDSDDVAGVNEKHHIPNGHVKIDMPPPMREEPRFPKEKWKTFIAFIILVFSFLVCTAALSLVHDRVPDRDTYGPLPDIVLDFIPAQDKALDVSEVLIMISVLTTFVFILVHKHRFIVFRRVFLMLSLLYLMRSLTMYVTVMPIASRTYFCSPKSNTTSAYEITMRVLRLVSGFGLSINGKHTYCGDYIYSGHTVILVLSYLIIAEYSPKKLFPLHWAMLLSAVVGIIMVLIAHGHYTVDVLIAYYITTRLFWVYHTLCNNPQLKQYTTNNFLGKTWWFPVFLYFEKNVGGVVPRQYEWPLSWPFSWPRRFTAKHPNRDS